MWLPDRRLSHRLGIVLFSGLLGGWAYAGEKHASQFTPDADSKAKALYAKQCQPCHGVQGKGDGPAGKRMNPKPLDFTDRAKMEKMTDEDMFKVVSKGKGPMPAFERKLSETDRRELVRYVRTFSGAEPAKSSAK
jgi:mono/diheme cytochrome c family protein